MKKSLFVLFIVVLAVFAAAAPVLAHGGHIRGGIWIGPGWWGPWWYPYPYYSQPPVVIQQQPPVYEEQEFQAQPQQYYWYFCSDSKAYYPYVKECPGGWLKVIPSPPSAPKR
ncbi:MAG TPA: hypothetical protein VK654_03310 [Nitrospirota bacterium]|nr:hypothetical protein [Nitrospirota bacterium]